MLVGPGTYVENIVVDKPIKVVSTNGESATVVKATDTSKDVILLSGSDITIQGFTVTSGKMGVVFGHTSNCVLTACVVNGNVFGVYLAGATGNLVGNTNLNNNGFGIYLDGSSRNKLSKNSASNEKGGGGNASLSDGIYMFNANANNVTHCELSNNQNFGVSLFSAKNNAFSNNTLSSNAQFGVRLRDGADKDQFSFNTFKANAENGVLIGDSQANTFYFNNFLAEKSNFTRKVATTSTPQRRSTIPSAAMRLADSSVTTTQIMLDPMQTGTESETPRLAEISILLSSLSRTMVWFNRLRRHLLPRLLRHLLLQPHMPILQAMQVSALQHFCLDLKLCQRCLGCCLRQ